MTERKNLLTYSDYARIAALPENRDRQLELIDGEIVEKVPSFIAARCTGQIHGLLFLAWRQVRIGRFLIGACYKLPDDEHNAVIPDLSYVADIADMPTDSRPIPRMPDLAIEIASPDDNDDALRDKAAYYLANGSRAVWLFFPRRAAAEVHRPNVESVTLTRHETLDGGEFLPGLRLPLDEIFGE